ncbi:MD-2-related lipid-recognition protein 3-like [Brassica napus]|uniref:MD-2-related lipid-recognition protein 3-like n=1 Tax=Brassica napus TaxID=3708 RepID=UPI0006AA7543|nr:MD-2-related lipid-recognition protein 3-like [Brassica napus]
MAMSKIQPVLLLFVSLFFLPALCSIDYEYCDKSGYDFGNVSYVDITPNPVGKEDKATLMIFGFAKNSIHGGYVGVSVKAGESTYNVARYPLCVLVPGCYIKAESKFFLPLKNLPHHFIEDESKNVYSIKLVDTDVGLIEAPIVRMCVEFELPTSAPTLISA